MSDQIEPTGATGKWELVQEYLSPVSKYFDDPEVTEIMINRFDSVYVERSGRIEETDCQFTDEEEVVTTIKMIATATGQSCDPENHPEVNARLDNGSRVCGVLAPWSAHGSSLCIRLFPKRVLTAGILLEKGSFTQPMLEYLTMAVRAHCNILVSGSTGSGKTTLLNVLSSFIPKDERVVTVEDTEELKIEVPNWVSFVTSNRRKETADAQETSMPSFIKTALRENPDRIIVGEMRDKEAANAFLQAINTGHNGCSSTLHANSPLDALMRLENFLGGAGLPVEYVESQVRSNLHVLIQAEKVPNVGRIIVAISEVRDASVHNMWTYDYRKKEHVKVFEDGESLVKSLANRYGLSV